MLDFYNKHQVLMHNDEVVHIFDQKMILDSVPDDKETNITWDTADEYAKKMFPCAGFYVRATKRGRIIFFTETDSLLFRGKNFRPVKEWKVDDFNLKLKIKIGYRKVANVSLEDAFKYYDSEMAIKYLKEREMTIGIQ